MKKIVKYHNDGNKITLSSLSDRSSKIFFSMIERFNRENTDTIEFNRSELKNFFKKDATNEELKEEILTLWEGLKKINHWTEEEKWEKNIVLFITFEIFYENKENEIIKSVKIRIHPDYKYMFNDVLKNFTAFELAEYTTIKGRYPQALYRFLKQYRSTGKARFNWEWLREMMQVPQFMRNGDFDQYIINFNVPILRKFFKNLTYEKIKDKSQRGRGGKIVAVEFTFTKQGDCIDVRTKDEKIEDLRVENGQLIQEKATVTIENNALKEKNEALKKVVGELQDQNFKMNFKEYTAMRVDNVDYGDTSEIIKIEKKKNEADLNSKTSYYIMATFKNLRTGVEWSFPFDNIDFFRNYLIKNSVFNETKMHNIAIADHRKININFR